MSITASLVLNGLHMYLLYCVCVRGCVSVCVWVRACVCAPSRSLRNTGMAEMGKLK